MANCFSCNDNCFGSGIGSSNNYRCVRNGTVNGGSYTSCRCCNGNDNNTLFPCNSCNNCNNNCNSCNGCNSCNNNPITPTPPIFPFPPQTGFNTLGLPAYAQFSSTAATLTTGTPLALTSVLNSGNGMINTTGNSVTLSGGVYNIAYALDATTPAGGGTVTVTPTLNGTPLTQYSATATTTAAEGVRLGNSFLVSANAGDTLSFALTSTAADPLTGGVFNATVEKIDSTQMPRVI